MCCLLWGATVLAPPSVSAEPGCRGGIDVRAVALPVDGEEATGRVQEPYRCVPGDLPPRDLVVAMHGHDGSSADHADYLTAIARRTGAPFLSMNLRSATSVWRTGEWNLWAGWRDLVAATQWYRAEPVEGPDRDYVVDVARGIVTAPPAPANATCAA